MDSKKYGELKIKRREIEKKLRDEPSNSNLKKELKSIKEELKKDTPTLDTVYSSIALPFGL